MISEITELAGREVASATGALPVTHGFGTHVPGTLAFAGVMFDHVSSELGTPNRRHAFETGIYIDPCPPGLQSGQLGEMDVRPIRPGVGRTAPDDRLPPQFLELPERPLVYVTLGTVFNDPELVRSVLDAVAGPADLDRGHDRAGDGPVDPRPAPGQRRGGARSSRRRC